MKCATTSSRWLALMGASAALCFSIVCMPRASAQGLQNVLHARGRVFAAVGPGVAAIRRDSSGRYFILAQPASEILVFDASGRHVDQFPNAHSNGVAIRYAVSIDVDSHGRLFVADRGDNAVKIFAPDGSHIVSVHVNAPTSVVALSDGQFAVTTLQSQRLVQIMDEHGAVVRTFGEPADEPGAAPGTNESGEGSYSRSSAAPAPQPVIDRGRITGDPNGNIYFAFTSLPDPTVQRFDRFGYSAYDSVIPAGAFGPLMKRTGHEVDLGYTMSGLSMPTTVSAWTDLHTLKSVSVGERVPHVRGSGAASAAASSSASSSSASSTPQVAPTDSTWDGDDVLSYDASTTSGDSDSNFSVFNASTIAGLNSAYGGGFAMPGMFGMGMGGMGFGDPFRGGFMRGAFGGGEGEGGFGGGHPDFAGHPPDGDHFEHGRPGFGVYRATANLRVELDNPALGVREKPVITALGVDPETHEVWAAISDTLVHLDSGGNRIDMYYLAITDASSIKPTSILVEPDRLLIAADPWGIYEFPRPDKPAAAIVAPAQPSPPPTSSTSR